MLLLGRFSSIYLYIWSTTHDNWGGYFTERFHKTNHMFVELWVHLNDIVLQNILVWHAFIICQRSSVIYFGKITSLDAKVQVRRCENTGPRMWKYCLDVLLGRFCYSLLSSGIFVNLLFKPLFRRFYAIIFRILTSLALSLTIVRDDLNAAQ